ncbi:MAG: PQQ-binding-like beta-propeller repeat protein [Candidatus Hydrogenedentes bacterium]|nr:PQQ-binding-like beta-propeller repeat protein [Candidatus Hydrogenedentota bacterium]
MKAFRTGWALFPALVLCVCALAPAGDVLNFRGPNRDGAFPGETGLMASWPEGGPPLLWTATGFGVGYSSAVVRGDRIYLTGTLEGQMSHVFELDLDGKELRRLPYGTETTKDQAPGGRGTPTLDGDRLFVLTSLGELACVDIPSWAVAWKVNILERFKGPLTEWDLSENLLVDGDRVICTPGGENAVMAALDKRTGDTVWVTQGLTDMTSYCGPALVTHNGRRIILTLTSKFVICVDADSGTLLWKHPHPTDWDVHPNTPLYHNGCVYYVAGYKSGGGLLELSPDASSFTVRWTDTELDCQHQGVVLAEGAIFGTSHHRSGGRLVCLDWETGKMLWDDKAIRQANLILADGMIYSYEGPKSGEVVLFKPSREGFQPAGKFTVAFGDREHWAHQVIANGRLYLRHGDALGCYDITQK